MPNFLDAPEILPLPSLQAYSSLSFLFLSCSLYYAFQITSEPDWRSNSSYTFQEQNQYLDGISGKNQTTNQQYNSGIVNALNETLSRDNLFTSFLNHYNASLKINDLLENQHFLRLFDVAYIMVHEPLCVWTLINMGYCLLILLGKVIQKLIFGDLRVSEQQLLRDRFWNFLIYKFIFVFSVINVQYMDELVLWCAWFSVLGFILVLTLLCTERFNYLTFSPAVSKWVHFRLLSLLVVIVCSIIPLFGVGIIVGMHTSFSIGAFLLTECLLLFLRTIYCIILYVVHLWDVSRDSIWEKRASINYYNELIFDLLILSIDFCHHLHMLIWGNIILSVSSLVIAVQLRAIFYDISRRITKHKNYLQVINLMEENFPVASDEELSRNNDDCAICWDHMSSARKLPCGHLFHTTCLRSWLEQDTSCPTCRHSLRHRDEEMADGGPDGADGEVGRGLFGNANTIRFTNHFFHFDGSRYARWLPTVSVEVTRPNVININASLNRNDFPPDFSQQQLEYMGQQVLEWFPQIALSTILDDLRVTRSVEHTIENILDGRLSQSTSSGAGNLMDLHAPSSSGTQIEEIRSTVDTDDEDDDDDDNDDDDDVHHTHSDSFISRLTTSSSTNIVPHSSTSTKVSNNQTSTSYTLFTSSSDTSSQKNISIEDQFTQLSSDERKSLLTKRKEEMFQNARMRFLLKNDNNDNGNNSQS